MKKNKGISMHNKYVRMKNATSGITLIALVVTIIVLIILAAVSLNMLFGDSGIIKKAGESSKTTKIESGRERIGVAVAASYGDDGKLSSSILETELDKVESSINYTDTTIFPITVNLDGYKYQIERNGEVTGGENVGANTSHGPKIDSQTGMLKVDYKPAGTDIKIPKGFAVAEVDSITGEVTGLLPTNQWDNYLETKLDEGIVITDNKIPKVGNEFVWVPVPESYKMFSTTGGKNIGKLYWNEGTWKFDEANITQTNLKEPNNIDADNVSNLSTWTFDLYQHTYNNMTKSVDENKGFYIGRYETSLSAGGIAQSKYNAEPMENKTWYQMYKYQRDMYTEDENYGVESCMIWGSAWDQVMLWMKNDENTIGGKYIYDSTGRGNYSNSLINTGSNKDFKVKNIYDMAGNVLEWTQESYGTSQRVSRRRQLY